MQDCNWLAENKKECCGCAACETICPQDAIGMHPDEEGFLYPEINNVRCINCGLCKKVCAFKLKDKDDRNSTVIRQYAIKYKRNEIRKKSQAGGSFAALAIALFENNDKAAVYGASFYEVYKVRHEAIYTESEVEKLQGSKYVQSDMQGIYKVIEQDIGSGYTVMFAGTPCQTHAVKQYLALKGIDIEKLYLMDFICEGVASPYVWEEYIKILEKKYKGTVEKVIFRNKELGWIDHYETIFLKGERRAIASKRWTNLFYDKLFFRSACHACKYTSLNRESDITVCWFGAVNKIIPGFDDGGGVSGMMINSDKGIRWFELIKYETECISVTIEDLMQKQLQHPIEISTKRRDFWKEFKSGNKWKTICKYDTANYKYNIKKWLRNIFRSEWKWI